ncbi:MAG: hypothetical protein CMH57_00895 [Myxococcales bacterium]|nr:hypothetical protein [Myxococcales bacterium]
MEWKGKKIIIAGRVTGGRRALIQRLTDAGAVIGSRVSNTTALFIKGTSPGARYDQAKTLGVPIATPPQVEALLAGEEVQLGDDLEEDTPAPAMNAALAELRDQLHAEPSRAGWRAICDTLAACDPGALPIAVDYVQQSSDSWGGAFATFATRWTLSSVGSWVNPHYHHLHLHREGTRYSAVSEEKLADMPRLDLRFAPLAWQRLLLQAETSPMLRVARVLGFHKVKITTTTARNLLSCPDLTHLRALYLTSRPLSPKFARELAAADNLPALTHLDISGARFGEQGARVIATSPRFDALLHINLASLGVEGVQGWDLPTSLQSLDLGSNQLIWGNHVEARLRDTGVTLAALTDLRALNLSANELRPAHLRLLLEAGAFARLQHLDLSVNPELGTTSANLLRDALAALPNLQRLHLSGAGVTGRDRKKLARSCEERGITLVT